MNDRVLLTGLFPILYPLVHILVFISILLKPTKESSSQVTGIVMIPALPFLGIIFYVLLGEKTSAANRESKYGSLSQDIRMRNILHCLNSYPLVALLVSKT